MRTIFLLTISLFFSCSLISQTLIAKTEDGRRVLLNDDNTWEYLDQIPKQKVKTSTTKNCDLPDNYNEPSGNEKIQRFLKRIDATTEDLKKHVAVDNATSENKIRIINISEQKGNGIYTLCVDGKQMKYRRTGSVFNRMGENPIGNN